MSTTALMPPPSAYGPRRDEILDITMGNSEQPLGALLHVQDGPTECSEFTFDRRWLGRELLFSPSPDLRCHPHGQWRAPADPHLAASTSPEACAGRNPGGKR